MCGRTWFAPTHGGASPSFTFDLYDKRKGIEKGDSCETKNSCYGGGDYIKSNCGAEEAKSEITDHKRSDADNSMASDFEKEHKWLITKIDKNIKDY